MSEIEQATRHLITFIRLLHEHYPEVSDAELIEMIPSL